MQKRSHRQLASALLLQQDFSARRFRWAFLLGSFEPDCNPLSYLKGPFPSLSFEGHNYSSSKKYLENNIRRLQGKTQWRLWNYYTLGRLTHYLADAFTYPHNANFSDGLAAHHVYETELRRFMKDYLTENPPPEGEPVDDLMAAIAVLHRQYLEGVAGFARDAQYILQTAGLLMANCVPANA